MNGMVKCPPESAGTVGRPEEADHQLEGCMVKQGDA